MKEKTTKTKKVATKPKAKAKKVAAKKVAKKAAKKTVKKAAKKTKVVSAVKKTVKHSKLNWADLSTMGEKRKAKQPHEIIKASIGDRLKARREALNAKDKTVKKAKKVAAKKMPLKVATPPVKATSKEKKELTPIQKQQLVNIALGIGYAIAKRNAKAKADADADAAAKVAAKKMPLKVAAKKKPNSESQLKIVKAHLLLKKSITSWEAITLYRITRLSAIIFKLKKSGMVIKTMLVLNLEGNNYAKYSVK